MPPPGFTPQNMAELAASGLDFGGFHPDDSGPGADDEPDPGPVAGDFAVPAVWLPGAFPVVTDGDTVALADRPPPRCTETWKDAEGRREGCGAVLDSQLQCGVCAGRRCYQHCRSVDHLQGFPYTAGSIDGQLAYAVVTQGNYFHWHVANPKSGRVIAYGSHRDGEAALAEAFAAVLTPMGSAHVPETHRHVPFAGDRGDETCTEADGFDAEIRRFAGEDPADHAAALAAATRTPNGTIPQTRLRRLVANALLTVLLNSEETWRRLRSRPDEAGQPEERAWDIRRTELLVLIEQLDRVLP